MEIVHFGILNTLKTAITMYRVGKLNFQQALTYTRRNSDGTGTQNFNYKYHMKYLNDSKLNSSSEDVIV